MKHSLGAVWESRWTSWLSVLTTLLVIEPCFSIGHNLSLICQLTSEDIKQHFIHTAWAQAVGIFQFPVCTILTWLVCFLCISRFPVRNKLIWSLIFSTQSTMRSWQGETSHQTTSIIGLLIFCTLIEKDYCSLSGDSVLCRARPPCERRLFYLFLTF